MLVSYCERWFQPRRKPIKPLSERDARVRHESRKPYCAVVGRPESPSNVIVLAAGWVNATFLDELGRDYLRYDFHEVDPGKLFLEQALFRQYERNTDEVTEATQFAFSTSGDVTIEQHDLRQQTISKRKWQGDTTPNWENYPSFGNYQPVCRLDRELSRHPS